MCLFFEGKWWMRLGLDIVDNVVDVELDLVVVVVVVSDELMDTGGDKPP